MTKKYLLTEQADSDIENIFIYTAKQWGVAQAQKYLLKLDKELLKLASGKIKGRNCSVLLSKTNIGLLYHHINKHYVIYRMHKEGIEILALYHDKMDLPRHLKKLSADTEMV